MNHEFTNEIPRRLTCTSHHSCRPPGRDIPRHWQTAPSQSACGSNDHLRGFDQQGIPKPSEHEKTATQGWQFGKGRYLNAGCGYKWWKISCFEKNGRRAMLTDQPKKATKISWTQKWISYATPNARSNTRCWVAFWDHNKYHKPYRKHNRKCNVGLRCS